MIRTLKFLRALVVENIGWKLLALATALMIWVLVASEPELTTLAAVRIEYKNLPDNLEITFVGEPVSSVSLELRGPSGEIRGVGDGGIRPAVVFDFSGMQPGERTFPIGPEYVRLSHGVHLVRAFPSQVRFRFEPRLTRMVPVQVRFTGQGRNGYVVANKEVAPSQLTIVGPASRVAQITQVTTDPVDVSRATGASEYRVNTFVDDPYVRFQGSPQVDVSVTMKKQ